MAGSARGRQSSMAADRDGRKSIKPRKSAIARWFEYDKSANAPDSDGASRHSANSSKKSTKENEPERGRTRTRASTRPLPVTAHDMGMFGVGFSGAWTPPPDPPTPSLPPPPPPPPLPATTRPVSSVYSQDNGEDSTAISTKNSSLSGTQEITLPKVPLSEIQAAMAAAPTLQLVARPSPPRLSPSSRIPVPKPSSPWQPPVSNNRWAYDNTNPGTAEQRYFQQQMAKIQGNDLRIARSYQRPESGNDEGFFINDRQNTLYHAPLMRDTRGECQPRLGGNSRASAESYLTATEALGPSNRQLCLSPSLQGTESFSNTPSNAQAHHNGRVCIRSSVKATKTFDMSAAYMDAINNPIDPRMSISAIPAPLALKTQPASGIPVKISRVASDQALCQAPRRPPTFALVTSRASSPNTVRAASKPRRPAFRAPSRSTTPNPEERFPRFQYTITKMSDLIEQNLRDIPILKQSQKDAVQVQKNAVRGVKFEDEVNGKFLMNNKSGVEEEIDFDRMEQNMLDFKRCYDSWRRFGDVKNDGPKPEVYFIAQNVKMSQLAKGKIHVAEGVPVSKVPLSSI